MASSDFVSKDIGTMVSLVGSYMYRLLFYHPGYEVPWWFM